MSERWNDSIDEPAESAREPLEPPSHEQPSHEELHEQLIENQRRTWEMELLISGAVVFALFQVPGAIDSGFDRLLSPLSEAQRWAVFFGYVYLKMIVLVLIAAFLVHLGTRAFWVGLIGLRSVYPHGIDWDEVHDGPLWQEVLREMPSLRTLAEETDRLASRVFSFAFIFVFFFLMSICYLAVIGAVGWLLEATLMPGFGGERMVLILAILFSIPSTIGGLADKSYKRRGIEPPPRVKRWLLPTLRFYHYAFLGSLTKPLLYTFTSNLRRKKAYPLLFGGFAVLYVGLFGHLIARGADRSLLHGYAYIPPRDGELAVRDRYYENLRQGGPRHAAFPSISSDIADGTYLKLFLPYVPDEDHATLEARCPELEPWSWHLKPPKQPPSRKQEAEAITCLQRLYVVELNGEPLDAEFQLYRHPQTRQRGLLAYLRTEELSPGRHELRIEETDIDREIPVVHHVPFWH